MGKNLGGRPPYEPTEKEKNVVMAMASCGIEQGVIARALQISKPTLIKHYRQTLDTAMALFNAKVCATYAQMATSGQHPGVTIFHMKCKLGFREHDRLDLNVDQKIDFASVRAYMASVPDA